MSDCVLVASESDWRHPCKQASIAIFMLIELSLLLVDDNGQVQQQQQQRQQYLITRLLHKGAREREGENAADEDDNGRG